MMNNLVDFFNIKTSEFEDDVFLRMERNNHLTEYTYSEIKNNVLKLRNALLSRGFKKNDKIALLCENRPEWGLVFWGVLSLGAELVPVDMKLTPEDIEFILKDSDTKAVFCSEKFVNMLCNLNITLDIYPLDKICEPDFTTLEELLNASSERADDIEIYPTDTALIVYTSGVTGKAKGVVLSHFNLLSDVNMVNGLFYSQFHKAGFLSILPLHHTFEITGGFLAPMSLGGSVTYIEDLKTETLMNNLKKYRPKVMLTVPVFLESIYNGIVKKAETDTVKSFMFNALKNISSLFYKMNIRMGRILFGGLFKNFGGNLRYFVSGAAPLDVKTAEQLEILGFEILEGYGLTETSPILTANTPQAKKLGSVGKPLAWVELKIVKPNPAGEGEITVKGPNIMQGYYKRADLTSKVLKNGWFYTGDIGAVDKDGFVYIRGRDKNVIVSSSGKNIYPEELEDKLSKEPVIKEICVTGRKTKMSEEIVAVIVSDEKQIKTGEKKEDIIKGIIENFNRKVPEYKRISDFIIWEGELPKTTTLKVKRALLEEELYKKQAEGKKKELDYTKDRLEKEPVLKKLLEAASKTTKMPVENISLKDRLYEDLGIDSLGKIDFICDIEEKLDIPIEDNKVAGLYTLEDIFDYIKKRSPADKVKKDKEINLYFLKKPSALVKILRTSFNVFYRIFAKTFFRLEFKGLKNLPEKEPYIIAPNHGGHIDLPSILSAFPLKELDNIFAPAAGDYFEKHPKTEFISYALFNTFSFQRYGNYIEGLKACVKVLKKGRNLIIFPEGVLSKDGNLNEFKSGAAEIAYEAGVKIVPAYIHGSYDAYPTGRYYPKPVKVIIYFGKPVEVKKEETEKQKNIIYKELTGTIKEEIINLKRSIS
ncbi:MAG: AMP-binding protein [Armatimonadota bacterium]